MDRLQKKPSENRGLNPRVRNVAGGYLQIVFDWGPRVQYAAAIEYGLVPQLRWIFSLRRDMKLKDARKTDIGLFGSAHNGLCTA